jgi:dienelactone hydrolase
MNRAAAQHGVHARNLLQLQLLEHREADDVRAAIRFLRTQPEIDSRDVGLIGDSFGSSLTLLVAIAIGIGAAGQAAVAHDPAAGRRSHRHHRDAKCPDE